MHVHTHAHVRVHMHIDAPSTRQTKRLLFPDIPKDSNPAFQMSFRENGGQLRKALSMRGGSRDVSWVKTLKRYRDDWVFGRNQVSYTFNPHYSPGRSVSPDDQRCLSHLGRSWMVRRDPCWSSCRAQLCDPGPAWLSLGSELLCMHLLGVTTYRKAKSTLPQPESCL